MNPGFGQDIKRMNVRTTPINLIITVINGKKILLTTVDHFLILNYFQILKHFLSFHFSNYKFPSIISSPRY